MEQESHCLTLSRLSWKPERQHNIFRFTKWNSFWASHNIFFQKSMYQRSIAGFIRESKWKNYICSIMSVTHLTSRSCILVVPYFTKNAKEIIRPLGSRSEGSICTDEGVVAKWSPVDVVEWPHFLYGRVLSKKVEQLPELAKHTQRKHSNAKKPPIILV